MYVVLKVHEKSKRAVDRKGLQFFYCSEVISLEKNAEESFMLFNKDAEESFMLFNKDADYQLHLPQFVHGMQFFFLITGYHGFTCRSGKLLSSKIIE